MQQISLYVIVDCIWPLHLVWSKCQYSKVRLG